jgi:hypothetical protein
MWSVISCFRCILVEGLQEGVKTSSVTSQTKKGSMTHWITDHQDDDQEKGTTDHQDDAFCYLVCGPICIPCA